MVPDRDHVAVLHCVFLDQLAIDVGAVGAVQILEKRIVEDVDDERVVAAHGRIIDTNIVIREAPNGVALFVHVVFRQDLSVQAEHQACHSDSINC